MEEQQSVPEAPKTEEPKPAPEDLAAKSFIDLMPKFLAKLEEQTNRQLKRVVTAWMEYPLVNQNPQLSYRHEKELFLMGLELMNCRFAMINAVMNMTEEEAKKLRDENLEKEKNEQV